MREGRTVLTHAFALGHGIEQILPGERRRAATRRLEEHVGTTRACAELLDQPGLADATTSFDHQRLPCAAAAGRQDLVEPGTENPQFATASGEGHAIPLK